MKQLVEQEEYVDQKLQAYAYGSELSELAAGWPAWCVVRKMPKLIFNIYRMECGRTRLDQNACL